MWSIKKENQIVSLFIVGRVNLAFAKAPFQKAKEI